MKLMDNWYDKAELKLLLENKNETQCSISTSQYIMSIDDEDKLFQKMILGKCCKGD